MKVRRNPENLTRVGQFHAKLVFLPDPLVRFEQGDELTEDLGNIRAVDLVDDEHVGLGYTRGGDRIPARGDDLFQRVPVDVAIVQLVDRNLAENLPVYAFARETLIRVPQPFDRSAMVILAIGAGNKTIAPGDLANRPELPVAVRHNDQGADFHVDPEGVHLGHIGIVAGRLGMILAPSFLDRFPFVEAGIGPIDVAAITQHNVPIADCVLEDCVIFRRPASSERHLEDLLASIEQRLLGVDCMATVFRGKIGNLLEDAIVRLQAEPSTGRTIVALFARDGPQSFDELFVGEGLVKRDKADAPLAMQGLIDFHQLLAAELRRLWTVTDFHGLGGCRIGLSRSRRPVKDQVGCSRHGRPHF